MNWMTDSGQGEKIMADKVAKMKVQVTNETIEMGPVRVQVTESKEPTTKKVRVRFIPSPDQPNVIQETRKQPSLVQKPDGIWVPEPKVCG
jgi:hypothetical protein